MSRSKTFDESSRRQSWKKDTDDFEDELRSRAKVSIQKAENKLKLEALSDASKRYNINNGDIGLDVKRAKISTTPTSPLSMPTFQSKYRTLENKIDEKRFKIEQDKINEKMPKKGSWRKEFAKFEDEMEIEKIRRENQKKIEMYSESNDSESRKENIAEIRIRPKTDEKEIVTRTETPMWEKENNRRAPPLSKPPRLEVSEPDETTTINVRLNPTAKPVDKLQEPPSVVEVEFATTVVLVKPIESLPVEKPLPEITAVEKKNTANSPPKWMSSSTKNNSEESTDTEGRNNEKLNLTNRLNSVIGNGNFEKAPEIVVESKDEEEVKAKPKWKRPGTSTGEPKTTGT